MDKSNLKPGHLKRIKSLALLSDEQLSAFLNYVEVVNCAQASSLFREGQPGDSMYLILEGQMRVSTQKKNGDGSLFLRMLEAGDSFGEVALLCQVSRTASVEAAQPSVLIKISADGLQRLLSEQPPLAAQFLYHIARSLGRQLNDLTTKLRASTEQTDMLSYCH